jgi:hypothetical protein
VNTHILEVGRAPAMPTRLEAPSIEAAALYLARRTGRADAALLARIAWYGGQVQIGLLTVRGWARSDLVCSCPHCGQQVYARAVTCAEEAEEAGLAAWVSPHHGGADSLRANIDWAGLNWVYPTASCEFCGDNLTFSCRRESPSPGPTISGKRAQP